ncbi:Sua5/YciO/YrdC/YwlC family protein [Pseudonocardia zijingensis]|jgi:tRNA A37 threonylcarbamoyladenosine synthetase subunit TsaC/SUA5/YrdC|uniref:YrdC-like domain-containing protein n=1 Tax=Pseudonocardia zijingensis TaxID=153376 RepID=A0ABP3YR92_9PSEU
MGRPDVPGDAKTVVDTLESGGIAIMPGNVGYALGATTPEALRTSFRTKGRAAHKRHALLGSWYMHEEIHVLDPAARAVVATLVLDYGLPLGVVAPFRRDHPVVRRIDDETLAASTVGDTLAMLVNNGPFHDECARLSVERTVPLLGSSANLTGTGTKFRVEDIQQPILDIADVVIDYGLRPFHHYRRSSTMIDFSTMQVIRIGSFYDVISEALQRHFGIALPEDPGFDTLPSGHLRDAG